MYEACEPTQPEPLRLGNNAPGRRDSKENKHHSPKTPAPKPPPQTPLNMNPVDVPFSPFPFYIGTHDAPSNKRRGKVMIGDKGWLMRTDEEQQPPPAPGRRDSKKTASSILGGIKKIAKDMVRRAFFTNSNNLLTAN